jgi:deoxyribonuclease (pyrimidine dimer)
MAEYRELPMVYGSLRRSLRTQAPIDVLEKIPNEFTLNKGHVLFFYDKLEFLSERYADLKKELYSRGYDLDVNRGYDLSEFPKVFHGNYKATDKDLLVSKQRVMFRFLEKPMWYTYKRFTYMTPEEYASMLYQGKSIPKEFNYE